MLPKGSKQFAQQYFGALLRTPQIFRRSAFRKRTLEEELSQALLRGSLRKAFGGLDLLLLGLGVVIGSGWTQLSGYAAQQYAGPSVILSYLVSGLAAFTAACCYAELCVEYPVSGGAFSYIMVTFGELPAFVTLAGLLLEYALGMAAVARGFSNYLARLCNLDPRQFVVEVFSGHTFDFAAAGVIVVMTLLLSLGVRESAVFISSMTVIKIVLLLFVAIAGYTKGSVDHMQPFIDPDFQVDGIFLAAAVIFFTYTGFDAIGNAAEEAQNVRHLPWALLGTVSVSMLLYFLLALALVLMAFPNASYPAVEILTFITAFIANNMKWMQYIVALAALSGILTALTVGMFSVSRIVMVASRDWLLPPFLARISPRTQTPLVAQLVLGVIIALLAMLVEVNLATSLVSFGTLIALWLVCNAQLYRRYWPGIQLRFTRYGTVEAAPTEQKVSRWALGRRLPVQKRRVLVWVHMLALNAVCIALDAYYQSSANITPAPSPPPAPPPDPSADANSSAALSGNYPAVQEGEVLGHVGLGTFWFALAWFLVTLSFQLWCPLEYEPAGWHVPWWLMPWLPSVAIGLIVFSVGSLPTSEYWKTGAYFGVVLVLYLLVSMPMSYIKHNKIDYVNTEELNVIELAFVNGQWQSARLPVSPIYSTMATASSARSSGLQLDPAGSLKTSGLMAPFDSALSAGLRLGQMSGAVRPSVSASEGSSSSLASPTTHTGGPGTSTFASNRVGAGRGHGQSSAVSSVQSAGSGPRLPSMQEE